MVIRRDPDKTREALLEAAAEEIYAQGFRSASIDNILRRTGVTKGALYHHFPSKNALGYAVIDDVIAPWARTMMAPLDDPALDPLTTLLELARAQLAEDTKATPVLGCPVNNLVHEMSALDEGFRTRLDAIMADWRASIARALRRGQADGSVRAGIDADDAAAFSLAAYEGCISLAKSSRHTDLYDACVRGMGEILGSLRPASGDASTAVA